MFAEMDDSAWGYSPDQIQIWTFDVNWTTSPPTASFKLAGNATHAPRTVTVTNPDCTSARQAACFTVQ